MTNAVSVSKTRDFLAVLAVWMALAVTLIFFARPNTSVPGLYYDEAQCAGMAKDFLTRHPHPHLPGTSFVTLWDRPFPTFATPYIGALKSWMLLPSFAVFGAKLSVLRLTTLGWGLGSLLLFMLWTWRWLGRNTALLAGALLAFDPTFFFIDVLDWGLVIPSFFCRFACFYFGLRWWQHRNETPKPKLNCCAFLAGLFAGLGFFNKVDFAVLLAGVLVAILCCNARLLWGLRPLRWSSGYTKPLVLACLGFLLAAGPMLVHVPSILNWVHSRTEPEIAQAELTHKFDTLLAMFDGSYFYRLMGTGGLFNTMYQTRAPIFAPIGVAFILAAGLLVFRSGKEARREAAFPLLAFLFITLGIFLMPGAVRIHHMVLVYPFPQLVVALAVTRFWAQRRTSAAMVAALFVLLLACQLLALDKTQRLICQTGGRGRWSDALSAFARQVDGRSDLTIVSLDWGFNEQLVFLTDGPKLNELFWPHHALERSSTNCIFLVHPFECSCFPFGQQFLERLRGSGAPEVQLQAWCDHQGQVAFYSFR